MNKQFICNDSFGNKIHAGDTVELFISWETTNSWESKVYWDALHGAWVDSHRAHIKLGLSSFRELSNFINQNTDECYCKVVKANKS